MARKKSNSSSQSDVEARVQAILAQIYQSIVDAYNKKHGTNYTVEDYMNGLLPGQDGSVPGGGPGTIQSDNPYLDNTSGSGSYGNPTGQSESGTNYGNGSYISFDDILRRFSGNSDFNQLLNALGIHLDDKLTKSQAQDWNKQLLDMMLQYYTTQEQRNYNAGVLAEQRLYDNPTNQLARLMGSGISRDAALAMLSGAGAGAAGAGSALIGQPAAAPQGIAASQSELNGVQSGSTIANTVFNGVQTVASLCGAGINIAQAIPQVEMLKAQSFMTQDQVKKYQATNHVAETLNNLVTNGVVSYDELTNAEDARAFLSNNKDNPNIAPLFQDGSYHTTFGSTLGNQMFSSHWDNVLKSRHAGQLMGAYADQQDLQTDLMSVADAQSRRDFYMTFQQQLRDLIMQDEQIALLWQQYINGDIQVQINGQILQQEKYRTNAARRQNYVDNTTFQAYKSAIEGTEPGPLGSSPTGQDMLNYNTWNGLVREYQNNFVLSDNKHTTRYKNANGNLVIGTNRSRYADFLNANADAAITGAFVDDLIKNNRLAGYNGNLGGIYQFFDMWHASGAADCVSTVNKVADKAGDAALFFVK